MDNPKYQNIKIIEDLSGALASGRIKITEDHLFFGIDHIQAVEFWEERLAKSHIPYVLAQVEATVYANNGVDRKYTRGYALFVEIENTGSIANEPDALDEEEFFDPFFDIDDGGAYGTC